MQKIILGNGYSILLPLGSVHQYAVFIYGLQALWLAMMVTIGIDSTHQLLVFNESAKGYARQPCQHY